MKIYCVHDRLINYWLTPIAADSDAAMKHSLSQVVNNTESMHAVTQAPHHYDLYQLGEVTEDGSLKAKKEFICSAADLIRSRGSYNDQRNQGRVPTGNAVAADGRPSPMEQAAPGASRSAPSAQRPPASSNGTTGVPRPVESEKSPPRAGSEGSEGSARVPEQIWGDNAASDFVNNTEP